MKLHLHFQSTYLFLFPKSPRGNFEYGEKLQEFINRSRRGIFRQMEIQRIAHQKFDDSLQLGRILRGRVNFELTRRVERASILSGTRRVRVDSGFWIT